MMWKKFGFGLLEIFSEVCEVCVGCGVIVYYDLVVKYCVNGSGNGGGNG